MDIASANAIEFGNHYFGIPGQGEYLWYDPFSGTWQRRQPNGGWPIGSVLTQLQRPSKKLKAMFSEESGTEPGVAIVALRPAREYIDALEKIVPDDKEIPISAFAVWRYRFGLPAGLRPRNGTTVTLEDLADALTVELGLSVDERDSVFTEVVPAGAPTTGLIGPDWPDDRIVTVISAPPSAAVVDVLAPAPPIDDPRDEELDYAALAPFALLPLESGDVDALIARAGEIVAQRGLLLPDPELLEQCVLALLTGHLVLQGPPGTGKTTLARVLAETFGCLSELQTATAEWSTYDVIGGLQPGVGANGEEILQPWLGHVPRAALRSARTTREHAEDPVAQPAQAHWLIIDEFSRAQVDKAIGGLYTVLGKSGEQSLELWFENEPGRKVVPFPSRFRMIATMNDVDGAFVYDLSQGLSRRFQFVYVGVPPESEIEAELRAALNHAGVWMAGQYPEQAGTADGQALAAGWSRDERFIAALTCLGKVVSRLRYDSFDAGGGWPLGTAQIGDVLRRVALRAQAPNLMPSLDSGIADQIVPQMSGVRPRVLQGFIDWAVGEFSVELPRTIRAAQHLRDTSATL